HRGRQDEQRNRGGAVPQRKDGAQLRELADGQAGAQQPYGSGILRGPETASRRAASPALMAAEAGRHRRGRSRPHPSSTRTNTTSGANTTSRGRWCCPRLDHYAAFWAVVSFLPLFDDDRRGHPRQVVGIHVADDGVLTRGVEGVLPRLARRQTRRFE